MTGAGGAGIGSGRACEYIIGGATGAGGLAMVGHMSVTVGMQHVSGDP